MKKRMFVCLLGLSLLLGMFTACGTENAVSDGATVPEVASAGDVVSAEPAKEPVAEEPEEPEDASAEAAEKAPQVESAVEESVVEESKTEEPQVCTVTFSDGQTFEATVGEDFVFFFQCDAPGDMGEPAEGEEGAGITASDGTVTYSNVGLGGPYSYPTSEKVTISGFTGDFEVTITEAATNMGATYTIYTDEQEIADAIAFAEEMAAQQAANPMPDGEGAPPDAPPAG